jgi:ligand-binding sensor domain-containing protein
MLVFLVFCDVIYSQNPEWLNYTNGDEVFAIVSSGNNLWIGTDGGLVKLDKTTEEITFYNRANANLPDNHIRSLALDSSGYLWIGTQYSGIGKFNGNNCQVFNTTNSNLPHDQWNTAIAIDPKGKIWIGSLMFLTIVDGAIWKSYETGNPLSAYFSINDIKFAKNGDQWIAASWGLGKFAGDSLIQGYAEIKKEILSLAVDKNDTLWIGTNGSGLMKFNGQNYTVFDTSNSDIPGNIIHDMKFDANGYLWLATENGLVKFDGSNWIIYNSQNSGLPTNFIYRIEIDKDDIIWIGTIGKGLIKFDGVNWKKYNLSNSLVPSSNYISSIAIDANDNVWLGTSALIKYDRSNWTLYDTSNSGLVGTFNGHIAVAKIESDKKGNLWIGYTGKPWLTKYDGQNWLHYDSSNSPFSKVLVSCLRVDKNDNLWGGVGFVGSSSGLVKYDGNNWTIYNMENSPLTSNWINDIEFDKYGNLWAGYDGGLAKYDGHNWYIFNTTNSSLPFNNVGRVAIDSEGIIWLATWYPGVAGIEYGWGLTRFDGINWTTYNIYNSPLTSNTIFDITVDKDDNLWLCTCAGGLVKYDRKNNWIIYNQLNSGIAFNSQGTLAIDSYGNKWITGENSSGLSVFREGGVILTEIDENKLPHLPQSFSLSQNYPNPFNPSTSIQYQIPTASFVSLRVFDLLGREITTLVNEWIPSGTYTINFDGSSLSSGVYFYSIGANNFRQTKKLVLLR